MPNPGPHEVQNFINNDPFEDFDDAEDSDLDLDEDEYVDCAMDCCGLCGKAGSEECEFECPFNRH
ncbi:MAG TPA: hypothetical protein VNE63_22220 [Candidatus Acidoferrales bacterium]|nr:hypothetical protein [Candidatus Acidoferrales bacterium]